MGYSKTSYTFTSLCGLYRGIVSLVAELQVFHSLIKNFFMYLKYYHTNFSITTA